MKSSPRHQHEDTFAYMELLTRQEREAFINRLFDLMEQYNETHGLKWHGWRLPRPVTQKMLSIPRQIMLDRIRNGERMAPPDEIANIAELIRANRLDRAMCNAITTAIPRSRAFILCSMRRS